MRMVDQVTLTPFGDGRWVLQTPTGRHLLVSDSSRRLLELLQAGSLPGILPRFNEEFQLSYSVEQLTELVQAQFAGLGLLAHDTAPPRPQAPEYLPVRWQLLAAPAAAALARPLAPLMSWPVLRWLLPVLALGAVLLAAGWHPAGAAGPLPVWLFAALVLLSSLIHELGHIAGCTRAGVRHGGIGVGLYLYVLPAFYADVTAIWQAPPAQRLIANGGGIVAQLTFALLLAGAALLLGIPALQPVVAAIVVMALWQLNIFSRHDGYWLLVDLTSCPRLLEDSRPLLAAAVRGQWPGTPGQWWQLGYAVANGAATTLLLGGALLRYGHQLPALPGHLATAGRAVLAGHAPHLAPGELPALLFGGLFARLLWQLLQRGWQALKRRNKN